MLKYGEFWGIIDIFNKWRSGVKTDRDDLVIDFNKSVLEKRTKRTFSGDYDKEFEKTYNLTNSSSY